jgi:hypothetical protein
MALLHFLYKDEALIASLYAQIFRGRLVRINHGQTETQSDDAEVGGNVKIVSGKAQWGNSFEESQHEIIDPHDAATLDVLNHLEQFSVAEQDCKKGDVLLLSGGLCLVPHEHRKLLLELGFEANKAEFNKILSDTIKVPKFRNAIIDLAKKSCIGEPNDIRFFFRSVSGKWYWGTLQKEFISPNMLTLQIAYGLDLLPVNMVALHLGGSFNTPEAVPTHPTGFAQGIHHMTSLTNAMLAGEGVSFTSALAPLALMQEINATDEGDDAET